MTHKGLFLLILFVAIAALILGSVALQQALTAKKIALSEIDIEEINSYTTPVFTEESQSYEYLAMYDISIANRCGPKVVLETIAKLNEGSGFLTLIQGEEVVGNEIDAKVFVGEKSINEIKGNPRLLKQIAKVDMGDRYEIGLSLQPGETKIIHIGIILNPYSEDLQPVANMVLVSFQFQLDIGKEYIFRRGFPVYPIQ